MKASALRVALLAPVLVLAFATNVQAQSADALIDKLVEKGILTSKEAIELREETDTNFTQAHAMKNLLPSWVKSLEISGDVRVRYEGFYSDSSFVNPGTANRYTWEDYNRFRYRLRFGATATMEGNLEAGFMLAAGQATSSGGNALSPNQDFSGNGSMNNIWIDQAYGKWSPLTGPDWTATVIAGKMQNPLQFDDMVFDPNYMPTGAGLQVSHQLNERHSLKLNGAAFILNDTVYDQNAPPNVGTTHVMDVDQAPYLLGGQLRWDAVWNPKISTTLGFAYLFIGNGTNLDNASVPNLNGGNTRNDAGALTNDYTPIVLDAALTYMASSFPLYNGPFPIRIGGEVMYNLSAPSSGNYDKQNYEAWSAGILFGRAGRKGTWELGYTYKWVGADSWYEEVEDNDFGAMYWQTPLYMLNNPGGVAVPNGFIPATPSASSGVPPNPNNSYYVPGTNAKGHIVRFAWSPADAFTLSLKWLLTTPINAYPVPNSLINGMSSVPQMSRIQVDGTWKF